MSAVTRWVEYSVSEAGTIGLGGTTGLGTRAFSQGDTPNGDKFNIGSSNNRLHVTIEGYTAPYITLASGTDLDPRFVAKDITEKLHNLGKGSLEWDQAQCVWENNKLKLYSGSLGSSASIAVTSGTNTAHTELGWGSKTEAVGSATSNTASGIAITTSGIYNGFFDEIYKIVISHVTTVGSPSKGGSNTYTGTMSAGGAYNHDSEDVTYSIYINTSNGSTMGGGTGFVPRMRWKSSTGNDDNQTNYVELLYPNYWYMVGTRGLMVKFTDAVFSNNDDWASNYAYQVACVRPLYASGSNTNSPIGTAKFIYSSSRGDDASTAQTTASTPVALGNKGVYVAFNGSNNLYAGDEYFVICTPPQPQSYDISVLNYGNVTVSTESPVKAVMFEIMSGAVEISTVKFGLQNDGSFSHHDTGDNDTKFRFGTVGPGNPVQTGGPDSTGKEWRASVSAADISSDTPPSYLYATKEDLAVVADADNSEAVGSSTYMGMCADPVWLNIKLGASEVGANSTINYRLYFDYS